MVQNFFPGEETGHKNEKLHSMAQEDYLEDNREKSMLKSVVENKETFVKANWEGAGSSTILVATSEVAEWLEV